MIECVIFDTGPLISAFQSDAIPTLKRLVSKAYTGPTCLEELERLGWAAETEVILEDGFLTISHLNEREETIARRIAIEVARRSREKEAAVHLGESEVIAMALRSESRGSAVLLDEKAARAVALRRGLQVSGFPGLLILAVRLRLLEPEQVSLMLQKCREQGTHYSENLIEFVHSKAKEVAVR